MGFLIQSGKAVAIIAVATGVGATKGNLFTDITEGITETANYIVNGNNADDPYKQIDTNLAYMQAGLGGIRALDTGGNQEIADQKNQALMMSAAGVAGPAIVAGTMLIINKFAWALFIGFAPIFILCLLFEQTKSMFTKWLNFGIGISVSLAVLSFMTAIAMKMILALTGVVMAQNFLDIAGGGFTQAAMQQGGLGLVLTALLVTVPNMAANFVGGFTSNFHGAGLNFGGGAPSRPPIGGGPMGSGTYGGGTVVGQNSPTSTSSDSTRQGGMYNQSPRHTLPSDTTGAPNYNVPRSSSAMGAASSIGEDSTSINSARNASTSAATGSSVAGGYAVGSMVASNGSGGGFTGGDSVGGGYASNGGFTGNSGGSSASGSSGIAVGSTSVAATSSNQAAQTFTPTADGNASAATVGTGGSGTVVNGSRTAVASVNDYTAIPKGKQNPAREG